MSVTVPAMLKLLHANCRAQLFKPEYFTEDTIKNLGGLKLRMVAPILRFPGHEVQPGYQVGTRTNGVDQPRWPDDLTVEVVT